MAKLQLGAVPVNPTDTARYGDHYPIQKYALASGDLWVLNGQDAVGTSLMTDSREIAVPFQLGVAVSITKLYVSVTTVGSAGSVIRLGVRAHDPSGCRPTSAAPLADGGTVSGTSIAIVSVTLGSALVLAPGWYWYTATSQGTAATQPTIQTSNGLWWPGPTRGLTTASLMGNNVRGLYQTGVSGALPSSWTTSTASTFAPRMAAQQT